MKLPRHRGETHRQALEDCRDIPEGRITRADEERMEKVLAGLGLGPVLRVFGGVETTLWVDTRGGTPQVVRRPGVKR